EIGNPRQLRSGSARFDEEERHRNARPKNDQVLPGVRRERAQGSDRGKDHKNPFCWNAQEELDVWIKRDKRGEDGEMHRGRARQSGASAQAPQSQKQRWHQQEQSIKPNVSALANEAFDFAPEEKEHVHFNCQPEQRITARRMDKRVSEKAPDLSLPNLPAI